MSEEGGPARKQQRTDYLAWGDYFMATAVLAEKRSKDPRRQVGACIVNEERKIVAVGYNGCPAGWDDDEFPWGYEEKLLYVCHAEMNAILNKNSSDVKNCTMYVTLFPCNECAKIIVQSGIKKVLYMEKTKKHDFKREMIASERMLRKANVEVSQFVAETKNIMINL